MEAPSACQPAARTSRSSAIESEPPDTASSNLPCSRVSAFNLLAIPNCRGTGLLQRLGGSDQNCSARALLVAGHRVGDIDCYSPVDGNAVTFCQECDLAICYGHCGDDIQNRQRDRSGH